MTSVFDFTKASEIIALRELRGVLSNRNFKNRSKSTKKNLAKVAMTKFRVKMFPNQMVVTKNHVFKPKNAQLSILCRRK